MQNLSFPECDGGRGGADQTTHVLVPSVMTNVSVADKLAHSRNIQTGGTKKR